MSDYLLSDLKNLIGKKQIIAIVGSGVSVAATQGDAVASWAGLIEHGVHRCASVIQGLPSNWVQRRKDDLNSGDMNDLLGVAEQVSTRLQAPKGGEFRRWLRETIGELRAKDRQLLEALRDLDVLLATTNYDDLLEEVTGLPAVTWRDHARVERVLRRDEPGIIHLHGHWRDPESIVLSVRSYEDVRRDDHAQTVLRAMRTLSSFLFIGCGDGLVDPNIGDLLRWSQSVFAEAEYRQFVLAHQSEHAKIQAQHSAQERLYVLSYGTQYTNLVPYLRQLRPTPPPDPHLPLQ